MKRPAPWRNNFGVFATDLQALSGKLPQKQADSGTLAVAISRFDSSETGSEEVSCATPD